MAHGQLTLVAFTNEHHGKFRCISAIQLVQNFLAIDCGFRYLVRVLM